MVAVNPRSTPIALVIAGAIIMSAAISGKTYGNLSDAIFEVVMFFGFLVILIAVVLYYWERKKYYDALSWHV
jgi:hypothetical protein